MSEVREELPAAGDMGERVPGTVGGTAGEGATGGQPYGAGTRYAPSRRRVQCPATPPEIVVCGCTPIVHKR